MTTPGTDLAQIQDQYGTGLEDFDEEGAIPRININHSAGTFKDALSGEEFPEMYGVLLGMVKQRVMWADDVETGAKPMCKSQNGKIGYPNVGDKPEDRFPWKDAPELNQSTQPMDEFGRTIIGCDTCPFAQWGAKTASGKSTPPRCRERHTYPIQFNREPSITGPFYETGILSLQGSGISPSKKYLSAFQRARRPTYSAVAKISLDTNKRGSVTYSVPVITKIAEIPMDEWEVYARDLGPMREFLQKPPRPGDDQDPNKVTQSAASAAANVGVGTATVTTAPVSAAVVQPAPVQAQAVQTPAAAVVNAAAAPEIVDAQIVDDDDDIPF